MKLALLSALLCISAGAADLIVSGSGNGGEVDGRYIQTGHARWECENVGRITLETDDWQLFNSIDEPYFHGPNEVYPWQDSWFICCDDNGTLPAPLITITPPMLRIVRNVAPKDRPVLHVSNVAWGARFYVERSRNLRDWEQVGLYYADGTGRFELAVNKNEQTAFYRLRYWSR
jgi:hypothetical protein